LYWLSIRFLSDGTVGVEELVGDESENRGATRRDASFGDQSEETRQELTDVLGGAEFGEALGEEVRRKVGGIIGRLGHSETEMPSAEAGMRDGKAAALAVSKGKGAARGVLGKRDRRCWCVGNGVDNGSGHSFLQ